MVVCVWGVSLRPFRSARTGFIRSASGRDNKENYHQGEKGYEQRVHSPNPNSPRHAAVSEFRTRPGVTFQSGGGKWRRRRRSGCTMDKLTINEEKKKRGAEETKEE